MIPAERCSCGQVRKDRRVEGQKERHGSWRPLPPSPAPPSLPRSRARRRRRILHSVLRAASHGEANRPRAMRSAHLLLGFVCRAVASMVEGSAEQVRQAPYRKLSVRFYRESPQAQETGFWPLCATRPRCALSAMCSASALPYNPRPPRCCRCSLWMQPRRRRRGWPRPPPSWCTQRGFRSICARLSNHSI